MREVSTKENRVYTKTHKRIHINRDIHVAVPCIL